MQFALAYENVIGRIVAICPAPDKFAHTYAGLAIWLGTAILLRSGRRSITPLAVVVVAEIANECIDRVAHGSWMWRDTLGDMTATWFWPVLLTLALRYTSVFARRGRR